MGLGKEVPGSCYNPGLLLQYLQINTALFPEIAEAKESEEEAAWEAKDEREEREVTENTSSQELRFWIQDKSLNPDSTTQQISIHNLESLFNLSEEPTLSFINGVITELNSWCDKN